MSISDTIGAVAASNPVVGVAVAQQSVAGAILAGLQSGQSDDQSASSLLGAVFGQAQEARQLLASVQPNLGRNIDTTA
jgi:hypothetical protein